MYPKEQFSGCSICVNVLWVVSAALLLASSFPSAAAAGYYHYCAELVWLIYSTDSLQNSQSLEKEIKC